MYLIDLVYRTVLTIANSDIRGNVKPDDARRLINLSIEEIYEGYFYELNRMLNRQNKGLIGNGIESLPSNIREKINHYIEPKTVNVSNDKLQLPSDVRYLESVFVNDNEVEILNGVREFQVVKKQSSKSYPIGYKSNSNTLVLYPKGYTEANITYLRNPKVPNWTYVVVRGSEMFNPSSSDFQDIDMHSSEVSNIIIRTLQKVGINLKEQDLAQVMQQQQNIEFNQEIQS